MHTPEGAKIQSATGVVCRQEARLYGIDAMQAGIPRENCNRYKLSLFPTDRKVGETPNDPERWQPTGRELRQLDKIMSVQEKSSFCERICLACCGGMNLRKLQLHFQIDGIGDAFLIKRPGRCGGICCSPLTMNTFANTGSELVQIGRVREDFSPCIFKYCEAAYCCNVYHDIEEGSEDSGFEKKYKVKLSMACCGRVNNCCGGTCCKHDQIYDIYDTDGNIVAHIQRTYAPEGQCLAFCRCCNLFQNYMLEFPPNATLEDRMLLITSLFQIDYQLLEKQAELSDLCDYIVHYLDWCF